MANPRYSYKNVNASGTTLVQKGVGTLHSITINAAGASGIAVYDQTSGAAPLIATISSGAPSGSTLIYDVQFSNGLTVVVGGNQDITLSIG